MADEIRAALRTFILSNFLVGESPDSLKDSTLLITSGIITSLTLLDLVSFIEQQFSVALQQEDLGPDRLDSIDRIASLVEERRKSSAATAS